ncbi:citrate lyase holo-[acyl-carrier protein] synthase [Lactobacillus crispatus]|jgi:holo-ACP synthase citX|uniref:citrate lyase holo-[acyl-carrier protein] synthase n=1 Tax=Lactobacillus crispatus TaxID=47770 RepID=A0A7H9E984_9LACO|nr:citrate lyase holo-[acyl-carrier protein] synthase [Lactobacillus crispatus]EEU19939.1 holo-ACP synthase CitX [Lactobacillus crispatus 125-2-CHN]QLL73815.1 citrate lyase holo-[acyl-carrier protein] synthase [Lactobacillus crispatus]
MNIFNEGKKQDIAQVLAAKDRRVAVQHKIFNKYPNQTLVDIKMNIPGPIKNNRYLTKMFMLGINELENAWTNLGYHFKLVTQLNDDSGCENFYVLSLSIEKVKRSTIDFENQISLGRLFDADVLVKNKQAAISRRDLGRQPRKCFLCDRPAKECARSRRHSVEQMQAFISQLYQEYVA